MQSVYALTDVAIHLIRMGDESVVADLVNLVDSGNPERQRAAAGFALAQIAQMFPEFLLPFIETIIAAAYDTNRTSYERGDLH